MALVLTACAGSGRDAGGSDPLGALIGRETGQQGSSAGLRPGPDASTFIGREVAQLEALVGRPALIRREGLNEFRRYDLPRCRVIAIVAPAGGMVQTLTTGPLVSGDAPPSFPSCTAGL
ncbi:hypothetical protein [Parvularcula lutaonensis]|uniref:Uncharacterized protein n=2 Tax=Parvularcula lutaonensis TaxID=491923 RepID=A0ABV7MCW0_9PROT|nr:hypothetical protein GCM10007148_20720 [Parvularcula lutaonensis]